MEMIPFLFIPLYTVMPFVSGAAASSYGRPFWKWVFIGVLLPGPSLLLLYWLTGKDEEREKAEEAQRAALTDSPSAPSVPSRRNAG